VDVDSAIFPRTAQPFTFTGLPGSAFLLDPSGRGATVSFSLNPDRTVSYDQQHLEGILTGAGTSSLTVHGVSITIDATALSYQSLDVDSAIFPRTAQPFTFTGLPGAAFLLDPSGSGATVNFSLGQDRMVSYDQPHLEGILTGFATSTLTVHGVTITIDATALAPSVPKLDVDGVIVATQNPFSLTLLPGTQFVFSFLGQQTEFHFTVGDDSKIDYEQSLDGILSGRSTSDLVIHGLFT
jgi:hypothetical protein